MADKVYKVCANPHFKRSGTMVMRRFHLPDKVSSKFITDIFPLLKDPKKPWLALTNGSMELRNKNNIPVQALAWGFKDMKPDPLESYNRLEDFLKNDPDWIKDDEAYIHFGFYTGKM